MNIFKDFSATLAVALCILAAPAQAQSQDQSQVQSQDQAQDQAQAGARDDRAQVLGSWYRMILELVRHTPTYSPPVASRAFAYTALIAYEATASGSDRLQSLTGQVAAVPMPPLREDGLAYDEDVILNTALAHAVDVYFSNTGPTGQRAKAALTKQLDALTAEGTDPDTLARSQAYGAALAEAIIAASADDGGAVVENLGFPMTYTLGGEPQDWVPTSLVQLQQAPLLPAWGQNRPFTLPDGEACPLPPPPAYSEDPGSEFYKQAMEVYDTSRSLTDEQKIIARFWSDDPMLSPTPPGHWVSIIFEIAERDALPVEDRVNALVRLGMAVSDGFIVNWRDKYRYDLLRPVTYIRRVIDPKWEPLLITPPFPEYPSGHSTQSGAVAQVLTATFGTPFPFTDSTHEADGLAPRDFPDFWTAAREAGISRLYGGIHFRAAIDLGLDQGACVGDHVNALKTWK
ncbi:vanadium-dependent haloperoxidase [Rhodobacter sp. HX-7-19]|uniref:Vanadium-dependent haloperoxidase n=1 Tax=Paragemmobacter kunshanensis TaxID=2583234 RepID=A0A6M1U9Z7_9RHOB|nr:vanadium-dependent haloperoxidase [Rhodobacter kunshanensis]NGQ91531.1 vanadium-dependent haloperoxidase [Rhodobacter kunshanensis]